MNVLSLFDGISCGRIALERAKIKVTNYFASEIDKYAIKISKANYPDIIHIGDVRQVDWFGLPKIDLLIGGSPCQGFSFAGKQLNFDDPRSKLFFDYVRILKELQPKYFLLENVVMKKEYQDIISEHLGVQPIKINSALVSAQNRNRLYWTNITDIKLPKDKGILLKDVIEDGYVDRDKSYCVLPGVDHKSSWNFYHNKRLHQIVKLGCIQVGMADLPTSRAQDKRVYSMDGKSPTLLAAVGGYKEPKVAIVQRPRGFNNGGEFTEKSPTLSSNSWQDNNHLTDGVYWRKLTPEECEALQTIPRGYTKHVSKSQRYKCIGNAWTVDVIAHIFKGLK